MIAGDVHRSQNGSGVAAGWGGSVQVKSWPNVRSGGEGITIQYGIGLPDDIPYSLPSSGTRLYYVFRPTANGGRYMLPPFVVDAWPGGTVRFASNVVHIEAIRFGNLVGPVDWYWSSCAGMAPATRAPTYTDAVLVIPAATISANIPMPHRARMVRILNLNNTLSQTTWYEYDHNGTARRNSEIATTRDIMISGLGGNYRIGNTNAAQQEFVPIFTLDI